MVGPASRASRSNHRDAASSARTSADRNLTMVEGGVFKWLGDTLSWTGAIKVYDFEGTAWTIDAASVAALDTEGDAVAIVVDRETHAATATAVKTDLAGVDYTSALDDNAQNGEGVIILGVRDSAGIFYLRGGTVLGEGQRSTLGVGPTSTELITVSSVPTGIADYADVLPGSSITFKDGLDDNTATDVALGTPYSVGTGALEIIRNGRVLIPDYAAEDVDTVPGHPAFEASGPRGDYHEVDSGLDVGGAATGFGTFVQFYAGNEPQIGDVLFIRVRQ